MGLPQRIPPEERRPRPEQVRWEKKERPLWPLLAVIAGVALLAAILYFMPRAPKASPPTPGAQVPDQPFIDTLQLSRVVVKPSPDFRSAIVQGEIENTGAQPVKGVLVDAIFQDDGGATVFRATVPMTEITSNGNTTNFADVPLKPNSPAGFRLEFAGLPQNWNHAVPQLRIVHVDTGGAGGNTTSGLQYPVAGGDAGQE